MTTPKNPFILPDWIRGDLLNALNNYFAVRKSKRLMVNQRIVNGRVAQLVCFRSYGGLDLVQIVDNASEGNGKKPWLRFYLPKGYERKPEKPVQKRSKNPDSPQIKQIRARIHTETQRIAKNKLWNNPEEMALLKKLHRDLETAVGDARKLVDLLPRKEAK